MNNDFQVQLVVWKGDESEKTYTQNFTATKPRHRIMLAFVGSKINAPGKYTLELKLNGQHEANHHIYAQLTTTPSFPLIKPN